MPSVWEIYPDLTPDDLRTLIAVTTQVLFEGASESEVDPDLLNESPMSWARAIEPDLQTVDPSMTVIDIRRVFEDRSSGLEICRAVLDHAAASPELRDQIAEAFAARKRKLTGVETVLLTGAIAVLAIRIKKIKFSKSGGSVDFEPAGEAVKLLIASLARAGLGGLGRGSQASE
jgi:hypothetical protein